LTKAPKSVKVGISGQADDIQGSVYEYGWRTASAQLGRVGSIVRSGQLRAIGGSVVEIALRALGAKDGKEVVIPSLGWVSVGTAVAATGAAVKVATVSRSLTSQAFLAAIRTALADVGLLVRQLQQ
jgi:hypothetical protein